MPARSAPVAPWEAQDKLQEQQFIDQHGLLKSRAEQALAGIEMRLGRKLTDAERELIEFSGNESLAEWTAIEAEIMLSAFALASNHWQSKLQLGGRFNPGTYVAAADWYCKWGMRLEIAVVSAIACLGLAIARDVYADSAVSVYGSGILAAALIVFFAAAGFQRRCAILRVREQLAYSRIVEQLIDDSARLTDILDHIPLPWRWLELRRCGRSMTDKVRLVVEHLPWYLSPARTNFRLRWLLWPWPERPPHKWWWYFDGLDSALNGGELCAFFADSLVLHIQERVRQRVARAPRT